MRFWLLAVLIFSESALAEEGALSSLPIPKDMPWEMQLLFWLLLSGVTLLFAACLWWLMRFVSAHDEFKSDVVGSMTEQGDKVDKAVRKIDEIATTMSQTAVKFERDTDMKLMAVHKQVVDMNATVQISQNKVELMGKQFDSMQKTADHNNEALKKSSDILTVHQRLLDSNANVLKTLIKKLGHEKVMVTTKKSEEENE